MKQAANEKRSLAHEAYNKCAYAEAEKLYTEVHDMFVQVASSTALSWCQSNVVA